MRKSLMPNASTASKNPNNSPPAQKSAHNKKPPIFSQSSPAKRRTFTKLDLKQDYLLHEIQEKRRFKEFLQEVYMNTKELIKGKKDADNVGKKGKNSFDLSQDVFKKNLQKKQFEKENSMQKKDLQSEKEVGGSSIINCTQLVALQQIINSKKLQVVSQTSIMRKKILFSSMWQDKQFYDFTQIQYGMKVNDIQERLQRSEQNLQEREKEKKLNGPDKRAIFKENNAKVVRFGLCQQDTQEGKSLEDFICVKRKLMSEIKKINLTYSDFSNVLKKQDFNAQNIQVDDQNTHPLIKSANKVKLQILNFAEIIKAYKMKCAKKTQKQKNTSQPILENIISQLYQKVNFFTKELLFQQHSSTKTKINQLKYQTEMLQNGIKELEGFKALVMLRNKKKQQAINEFHNKNLKSADKMTLDDEVLRLILEHQLLTKNLTLKSETKFSGLQKKNRMSLSYSQTKCQLNYFRNALKMKRCVSQSKILLNKAEQQSLSLFIESKSKNPKKQGLKVVSSTSSPPNLKQIGSSSETNP